MSSVSQIISYLSFCICPFYLNLYFKIYLRCYLYQNSQLIRNWKKKSYLWQNKEISTYNFSLGISQVPVAEDNTNMHNLQEERLDFIHILRKLSQSMVRWLQQETLVQRSHLAQSDWEADQGNQRGRGKGPDIDPEKCALILQLDPKANQVGSTHCHLPVLVTFTPEHIQLNCTQSPDTDNASS